MLGAGPCYPGMAETQVQHAHVLLTACMWVCTHGTQARTFSVVMDVFRHPSEGWPHMTGTLEELGMRKGAV